MGALTAAGLIFIGETPRFLESVGRSGEALKMWRSLRCGDEALAAEELARVRAELAEERRAGSAATWGEVFSNPHFRNVVILGCTVQFFQIMTSAARSSRPQASWRSCRP